MERGNENRANNFSDNIKPIKSFGPFSYKNLGGIPIDEQNVMYKAGALRS